MIGAVAGYINRIRVLRARPGELLNSGAVAPGAIVSARHPEISVPADMLELWRVFDGMTHVEGVTLDDLWLEGAFYFFSEQEALDDYAVCFPLWESETTFREYWPMGFFPVATPGDGSRLLVNCIPGSPTHGAVYELFHGVGVSKSSVSIAQYFLTAAAWLAEGATWLDRQKRIDRNFENSTAIAARLNPNCDSWDDSLPPACETKDWLT